MTVSNLRGLLSSLTEFLSLSQASPKARELEQLQEALRPFDQYEWAVFGQFLKSADQAVREGKWPEPGAKSKKPIEPKSSDLSTVELGEKLKALNDRLADPELSGEQLGAELAPLDKLTHPKLREVAAMLDLDKGLSSKKTKGPYLQAFKAHFIDLWGGHQRRHADR